MALKLMGKKTGMMQVFDDKGNVVVCTVIHAEPNVITQIKTKESDGYNAIQLGFEKILAKDPRKLAARAGKPMAGHFKRANVEPRRHLAESRVDNVGEYGVGQEISLNVFQNVGFVDVMGVSKGKGFQGVMKLHNFKGGPASHGSGFHRHAGSTGMRSTPGRCLPGGKRASHMGSDQVTVQNLKVVMINEEENVILVKGAVPGPNGALLTISVANKKPTK